MKTEKLSLGNIKNKLSRAEMKKIMAGSGFNCCMCFGGGGGYFVSMPPNGCGTACGGNLSMPQIC